MFALSGWEIRLCWSLVCVILLMTTQKNVTNLNKFRELGGHTERGFVGDDEEEAVPVELHEAGNDVRAVCDAILQLTRL